MVLDGLRGVFAFLCKRQGFKSPSQGSYFGTDCFGVPANSPRARQRWCCDKWGLGCEAVRDRIGEGLDGHGIRNRCGHAEYVGRSINMGCLFKRFLFVFVLLFRPRFVTPFTRNMNGD